MNIVKNFKTYTITEKPKKWIISIVMGKMPVDFELSKKDYQTIEDVKNYILNNDTF